MSGTLASALPKRLSSFPTWTSTLQHVLRTGATDGDAFYVANLSQVKRQLGRWKSLLPTVEPHYGTCCSCSFVAFSGGGGRLVAYHAQFPPVYASATKNALRLLMRSPWRAAPFRAAFA